MLHPLEQTNQICIFPTTPNGLVSLETDSPWAWSKAAVMQVASGSTPMSRMEKLG